MPRRTVPIEQANATRTDIGLRDESAQERKVLEIRNPKMDRNSAHRTNPDLCQHSAVIPHSVRPSVVRYAFETNTTSSETLRRGLESFQGGIQVISFLIKCAFLCRFNFWKLTMPHHSHRQPDPREHGGRVKEIRINLRTANVLRVEPAPVQGFLQRLQV
jgi:hypothetical protein